MSKPETPFFGNSHSLPRIEKNPLKGTPKKGTPKPDTPIFGNSHSRCSRGYAHPWDMDFFAAADASMLGFRV